MSKNASASSTQSRISSFFSQTPSPSVSQTRKRTSSPIDLTLDSEGESNRLPVKKAKRSADAPSSIQEFEPCRSYLRASDTTHSLEGDVCGPSTSRIVQSKRLTAKPQKPKPPYPTLPNKVKDKGVSITSLDSDTDGAGETQGGETETDDDSDHAFKELSSHFANKNTKGRAKATLAPSGRRATVRHVGPSGQTYTPLEEQVLKLKDENPGTLLMVEVGYKYKFFGKDAEIAARDLGIICYPDRNFTVASVPVHRKAVHLKKLLSQGNRVGIVNQIETAALKKIGDNRNAPFDRKLTHLYTAATYVDDLDSADDVEMDSAPPLMCIVEDQKGDSDADVSIGMITISPNTGDIVWDEFDDNVMRMELETRLVHTKPAELLLPASRLSNPSEKMLAHFTGVSRLGVHTRIERFRGRLSYTDAFALISKFYTDKAKSSVASESFNSGNLIATVTDFPQRVVIVLAHAIKHLSAFGIADAFLETKFFTRFTDKAHMLLGANALINLEIYRNETDYTTKGSLMWILDQTRTKFGARMLRSWVGRPLVDKAVLQARTDAVEEIISSTSATLQSLRELFKKKLPDLAKGLCRIQYCQCSPQELASLLSAFSKLANAYDHFTTPQDVGFKSDILNEIVYALPKLKHPVANILNVISLKMATEGNKELLWNDADRYPEVTGLQLAIQMVEIELEAELKNIRKLLQRPSLKWTEVAGEEYLVEVKKTENQLVPDTWILVSRTKYLERYHTPEVKQKIQERARSQEALQAEAHRAFQSFLREISSKYYAVFRDAVHKLAMFDCLQSLALVALQANYVRPEFTESDTIEIVAGRHPMIEALRSDPFIPNSIDMGVHEPRNKIITGPNMGGKSSCVRMIALIAIMAQIGSYVPAQSVKLGVLDTILTRMGASDDLSRGRSTFMVEMTETSEILYQATSKSLVILDELGRGTSTFDGMAIADAVLQHLVSVTECKTLFITHYPLVANDLESIYPSKVQNLHMGYTAEERMDGTKEITFSYTLTPGLSSASFGVECGRLAGLPDSIIVAAAVHAARMRDEVQKRRRRNQIHQCIQLLNRCLDSQGGGVAALDRLITLSTTSICDGGNVFHNHRK